MEKPKRARRRKSDTVKVDLKPPLAVPGGQGVRREAESEGHAATQVNLRLSIDIPLDGVRTGVFSLSRISLAETCLLARRRPVYRRRDSQSGFCVELGNLHEDVKGKCSSGKDREAESTDASSRDGLLRISDEAAVMALERRERQPSLGWVNW